MPPPPSGLFDDLVDPSPAPIPAPIPAPAPAPPAPAPSGMFDDLVEAPPTLGERALGYAAAIPATVAKIATGTQRALTGIGDELGLLSPEQIARSRALAGEVDQSANAMTRNAPGATGASGLAATILPFLIPGAGPALGAGIAGGEGIDAAREKGFGRLAAGGVGAAKAAILAKLPGGVEGLAERLLEPGIARSAVTGAATAAGIGGADAAVTATYDPEAAKDELKSIPLAAAGFGMLGGAGAALGRLGGERAPVAEAAPVESAHDAPTAPTGMFDDLVAPAPADRGTSGTEAPAPVETVENQPIPEGATSEARPEQIPQARDQGPEVAQGAPRQPELPGDASPGRAVPAGEAQGRVPAGEAPVPRSSEAVRPVERLNDPLAAFDAETAPPAPETTLRERIQKGTTTPEERGAIGNLANGLGQVETIVHADPSTGKVDPNYEIGGRAIGRGHHQARVGMSRFVKQLHDQHGSNGVKSLESSIRRASEGKPLAGKSVGDQHLAEHAHWAIENAAEADRGGQPAPSDATDMGGDTSFDFGANAETPDAGRGGSPAPAEPAQRAAAVLPETARAGQPEPGKPVAVSPVGEGRAAAGDGAGPGDRAPGASGAADEPVANQRATSTRPDLAIPTDRPAAREVFKEADANRTANGEPAPVSHASTREAAAERLSADFAGEHAKLKAKVERGDALNAQERVMGKVIVERLTASGDLAEAVHAADVYRRGSAEGARALNIGYDPSEPPHERIQRTVRDALLEDQRARNASIAGDVKKHEELLAQHAAQIHEVAAKVEQLTGIDPLAIDQPPKPKAQRSKITAASLSVDREFTDLTKQLKKAFKDALDSKSLGSTGGEVADVLTKMIVNRLKKGALKVADMAVTLARVIPELRKNAALQAAFKQAWEKVKPDEPIADVGALFKPTIDEQVAAAEKRRAAALERHKEAFGQTPEERLAALDRKEHAKAEIPDEVQAINREIKDLATQVRNRDRAIAVNARRVLDAIATVKSDVFDKVYEFRRNVVHTSVALAPKKIASDIFNTLHHALTDWVGRPIANLGGKTGGSDTASLSDLPYVVRGLMPGIRDGVRMAMTAWAEQRNVWQDELHGARVAKAMETGEAFQDEFHQPRAIAGKVGTLTGANIRAVGAFQTFAETLLARLQVGAEAHRRAFDAEGNRLTGQALEDHMYRETSDLTSESWTQADTTAKDITGVTPHKTGPIAWLDRIANMKPKNAWERTAKELVRHLTLFRTLPFNFLVKGIYHMTPLNGLSLLSRGAKSLTGLALRKEGWTYKRAQFNTDIARHAIGWAGLLLTSSLMDDENGDPRITGYGKWTPSQSDVPLPPPHSIRLFGTWHNYSGLGPLGHALGLYVDILRGVKHWGNGEPGQNAMTDVAGSAKSQVVSDTWLRSLADIDRAFENGVSAGKFAGTFASSFYPTMFKDLGKATDATVPDHQVKEQGFWSRGAQAFEQQLGIPGLRMTPSVDVFGREIAKDDPLTGPATSFMLRLVNPFTGPNDVRDNVDGYRKMIVRWNEDHPTEQLLPRAPAPFVTIGKKRTDLTEQQYHDLCVDAGERAVRILSRAKLNTDAPSARDALILKTAVQNAQAAARDKLKATIARENRRVSSRTSGSAGSSKP